MKKKILALALSLTLIAAAVVGGTFAYLSDVQSDVNVMTMGSVYIKQHEYQRAVNADGTFKTSVVDERISYVLEKFEQGKPILPIVGDPTLPGNAAGYAGWDTTTVRMSQVGSYGGMDVFAGKNAVDKFVVVENTGKSDAYIRTIVAIEVGNGDASLIGTSNHGTWEKNNIGLSVIDGNTYFVCEYTYLGGQLSDGSWRHEGGVLPAGDTAYPSLSQVYLKSIANNKDCEAIDGNKNGTLDILVVTQAVQVAGFDNATQALDTAFGDITTTDNPWNGTNAVEFKLPVLVETAEDLVTAISNGQDVLLNADVTLEDAPLTITNDTVINTNGKTISGVATNSSSSALITVNEGTTLTITGNGKISFGATTPDTNWGGVGQPAFPGYANNTISCKGNLVIDGVTVENVTAPGGASYAIDCYQGSDLVINDGVIDGHGKVAIRMFCNSNTLATNVTVNGGTITGRRAIWVQLPGSNINNVRPVNLTITGGELISTDPADVCVYSYSFGDSFAGTNITISGGTFTGDVAFGGGEKTTRENVTITGGTFNGELGRYLANDGWEDIAKPQ